LKIDIINYLNKLTINYGLKKLRRLILHIGTEKTGTSSIQSFLEVNRYKLSKKGIEIPLCTRWITLNNLISGNQRWVPFFAYSKNHEDDFTLNTFKKDKDKREKEFLLKLKKFKNEIRNSKGNTFIISSEHFSSQLRKAENLYNLKKILSPLFDEIKILIYVRDPINHAISFFSTRVKSGQNVLKEYKELGYIKTFKPEIFSKYCNAKNIIKRWESVFSKEKMIVRIFHPKNFFENDLYRDFCNSCQIDFSNDFQIPITRNESLNILQLKYLIYCNSKIKRIKNFKLNPKWKKIREKISKIKSEDSFLPSQNEVNNFQSYFKEDIEWIIDNYFQGKNQIWNTYNRGFRKGDEFLFELSIKEKIILNTICKFN